MSSLARGNSILPIEISHISQHGVWLIAHNKEYFMSYKDFPWFKSKTVEEILSVEEQTPGHFYWPELDVDLTQEMIEHPDRFSLTAKIT